MQMISSYAKAKERYIANVAREKEGFPTDRRVDIVVNNRTFKKIPPEKKKIPVKPKKDTARTVSITSFEEIKNMKPGSAFRLE